MRAGAVQPRPHDRRRSTTAHGWAGLRGRKRRNGCSLGPLYGCGGRVTATTTATAPHPRLLSPARRDQEREHGDGRRQAVTCRRSHSPIAHRARGSPGPHGTARPYRREALTHRSPCPRVSRPARYGTPVPPGGAHRSSTVPAGLQARTPLLGVGTPQRCPPPRAERQAPGRRRQGGTRLLHRE